MNRPENPDDFMKGNFGFTSELLNCLKKYQNKATIILSSSIQATLAGRFGDSEYGRSKLAGEQLLFDYGKENGVRIAVYRFPNLMGHNRPKYNSAVSTFCWAVANNEPYTVNDRSTELELLYIDDLVEGMFDLLEGREQHWHNSKWELFIVVAGYGLIQERNIDTKEMVEFEVSGDKIEAVYMIPGWTHNIINLSETENLVTVMTCNEVFDKRRPDTLFEIV